MPLALTPLVGGEFLFKAELPNSVLLLLYLVSLVPTAKKRTFLLSKKLASLGIMVAQFKHPPSITPLWYRGGMVGPLNWTER